MGSYGIEELEFNLGPQGQNQKIEVRRQGRSKLPNNCSEVFQIIAPRFLHDLVLLLFEMMIAGYSGKQVTSQRAFVAQM